MDLEEARGLVEQVEPLLVESPFVIAHTFRRDGRTLRLALTNRLHKRCKRRHIWNSKAFLTTFKNARYGFDAIRSQSPGGSDGIFVLTRTHRPQNKMMRRIFDGFLDKPGSGAKEIAAAIGCSVESFIPVRLVSHHLRLLGVMSREGDADILVLVDYDDTR